MQKMYKSSVVFHFVYCFRHIANDEIAWTFKPKLESYKQQTENPNKNNEFLNFIIFFTAI